MTNIWERLPGITFHRLDLKQIDQFVKDQKEEAAFYDVGPGVVKTGLTRAERSKLTKQRQRDVDTKTAAVLVSWGAHNGTEIDLDKKIKKLEARERGRKVVLENMFVEDANAISQAIERARQEVADAKRANERTNLSLHPSKRGLHF